MKRLRAFLAAVITLSLVAGYGSIQTNDTAAAAVKKNDTVKAASDFTLKLPAGWKNNYVRKSTKNEKHGSHVVFYSKKCYKETKDGWLFSIQRYKDDSYSDLPSYELVGRWNGMNYVAVFPTEVQTMGASKAAKKQYRKLCGDSFPAAASIMPVKKAGKGKGIYRTSAFSLKLPEDWNNNYTVTQSEKKGKDFYVSFYAKECHKQTKAGWLFSIEAYVDESYQDLPAYELVGKWNGISYVAVFPTDVQSEGASKKAAKQYQKLSRSVEKVARSIRR